MSSEPSLIDLLEAQGIDVDAELGEPSAKRLRHICDIVSGVVYLPYGWIDMFPPNNPAASPQVRIRVDDHAGVAAHPSNPAQLILVSITIAGEESVGAKQWVSIAHLAHRDCSQCAHVWVRRAEEYEVGAQAVRTHAPDSDERWSLFERTSTEDDQAVVLTHIGDHGDQPLS